MLTVACVQVGTKYEEHYVDRLRTMVARNLSVPHRFEVIRRPPLLPGADGCWSKLWLFEPLFAQDKVLYLDLDVIVTGSLDALVSGNGFRAMRDPRSTESRPKLNSSAMVWLPGDQSDRIHSAHLRHRPEGKPLGFWRGDQEFIQHQLGEFWDPLPGVHSYKMGLKPDTVVAVFHGTPKPHDLPVDDPLRRTWEDQ